MFTWHLLITYYNRASRVVEGGNEYTVRYCHKKIDWEFYICLYMPLMDSQVHCRYAPGGMSVFERASLMAVMEDLSKEKHRWQIRTISSTRWMVEVLCLMMSGCRSIGAMSCGKIYCWPWLVSSDVKPWCHVALQEVKDDLEHVVMPGGVAPKSRAFWQKFRTWARDWVSQQSGHCGEDCLIHINTLTLWGSVSITALRAKLNPLREAEDSCGPTLGCTALIVSHS